MRKSILIGLLPVLPLLLLEIWPDWQPQKLRLEEEMPVADLLTSLGDDSVAHTVNYSIAGVSALRGEELFKFGITTDPDGGKTRKQSRHYVCTSCHNIEREDPDLRYSDPVARLEYVEEKGLPFLQGTALYGAVNRTSFYNGDYQKKYGELVFKARNNLREAIQLCAVECSQGRSLEPWEMESVLAYLWTIGLKVNDLVLSDSEKTQIEDALGGRDQEAAIQLIKSKYLSGSPATNILPPENRSEGYPGIEGDPAKGKPIYELSCLYCHEGGRYAFFELDDSKNTFKYLENHLSRYTRYSLYQVVRYGTSPLNGKRTYMPYYTSEKMTNQQLEDLRAYIEMRANE